MANRADKNPPAGPVRWSPGRALPLGAWPVPGGINFSIASTAARGVRLVLFERDAPEAFAELVLSEDCRIGHVWSIFVQDVDPSRIEYGFQIDGPRDPAAGHRFDPGKIVLDPHARQLGGAPVWRGAPPPRRELLRRARIPVEPFDWRGDRPLDLPVEELVIYELHVRGFTRHASSSVRNPGTFDGVREKIPYLRDLGITCVELMPVFDFDEFENYRSVDGSDDLLVNYWGYSPIAFFAPKAGFAAAGPSGGECNELKELVRELHAAGIEVVLDVVFNHTAEGNEHGPMLSFRGIDNRTYYMLTPDGGYLNFSGCGNTLNCNNLIVRDLIRECLRFWVCEYHIDGFRFDLASILGRDPWGKPLSNPPLLEALAMDPVLGKTKLIAEAWDAGGLYQVGSFPHYDRWIEWNGKFRDAVRRFVKGEPGQAGELARRMMGSPQMYRGRGSNASVNFVTCHDGFTLMDLVSYNGKHNEANGESGRDGSDDNHSWNCGHEGPTDDPAINALRLRLIRNHLTILLVSQGVPMLSMGDEIGRSQRGNNNAYCQDNPTSWLDWSLVEHHPELLRFTTKLIALRRRHPALRFPLHPGDTAPDGTYLHVDWHGTKPWMADWSEDGRVVAFRVRRYGPGMDDQLYVALNAYWEPVTFEVPPPEGPAGWCLAVDTAAPSPLDVRDPADEPRIRHRSLRLEARSIVVLVVHGARAQTASRA